MARPTVNERHKALAAARSGNDAALSAVFADYPGVVKAVDKQGMTLLTLLAHEGDKRAVELVLRHGANVNLPDEHGNSPIHYAAVSGNSAIIELLVKHGANVNAHGVSENTALHFAAREGHWGACERLLQLGAAPEARCVHDCTAVHLAASEGHAEVLGVLVANGCDINALDDAHRTPLHWATARNEQQAVKALVEAGADKSIRSSDGMTPGAIALQCSSDEIIALLGETPDSLEVDEALVDRLVRSLQENNDESTEYEIVRSDGGLFFLAADHDLITTPQGCPIGSNHEELIRELCADAARSGIAAMGSTSFVTLQISYLDFGVSTPLSTLKASLRDELRNDVVFTRSADPEIWKIQQVAHGCCVERSVEETCNKVTLLLDGFSRRQVMSSIVAYRNMGSAVLAVLLVAGEITVRQASVGLCSRYFSENIERVAREFHGIRFGGDPYADLYTPASYDDQHCGNCVQGSEMTDEQFLGGCAVARVADKIRRFSRFPDQP